MDYSAPIFFVPLGVPTRTTPQKPAPTRAPVKKTPAVPVKTAAPKATPIVTPSSFAKASADIKKPTTVAAVIPKKVAEPIKEAPKIQPKKEEVKKEIPKVVPKIEPTKEIAVVEPPKPIQEVPKIVPPVAQALDVAQTITPVIPENAHISHNYREVEALRRSAQLQKELVQKWKPPIGVSPDCMCEVSFLVNATGKIEDLKMVKNSGVVMYDISVRQALFAMKMPQWAHGKTFTIGFKQ